MAHNEQGQYQELYAILMSLAERISCMEAKIDELLQHRDQTVSNMDRIVELEQKVARHEERWKMIALVAGVAGGVIQGLISLLTHFVHYIK